jgi:hypothetical protein
MVTYFVPYSPVDSREIVNVYAAKITASPIDVSLRRPPFLFRKRIQV